MSHSFIQNLLLYNCKHGVARILCRGGDRFGVVKRPKIIKCIYMLYHPRQRYSWVCVIALGLCVIHIQ